MKWQDTRIYISGSGGIIGSHLGDELLSKGADVIAFVHYNAWTDWGMLEGRYNDKNHNQNVIAGDVTDSLFVKKNIIENEHVFHFAAPIIRCANPKARICYEQIRVCPEKSEVIQLLCDNRSTKDLAVWDPKFTFKDGFSLTIDWMVEHIMAHKSGIYTT